MTDFLLRLLQMSVAGSLLAGLLHLWQRFLWKETVHTIFYYMWLLVLLRLSVPFGVTVLLPAPGEIAAVPNQISSAHRKSDWPVSGGNDVLQPQAGAPKADSPDTLPPSDTGTGAIVSNASQKTLRGLSELLSEPMLWLLLWGIGAAVCLGRYVAGYIRFVRAVQKTASEASTEAWEVLRSLDPDGRVCLLECPFVATPMLVGLLRPAIILPSGVGEEGVLRDILAHELVHARRRDLLYKWFAVAVTSLHWFNPVMIPVRKEIGRACELSCDEAVMRGMDGEARWHYGETLLRLAASLPAGSGLVAMTLCEEKEQLKERLVSIATYRRKGVAAVFVSVFVAVFLGGCGMISGARFAGADAAGEGAGALPRDTADEEVSGGVPETELAITFSSADVTGENAGASQPEDHADMSADSGKSTMDLLGEVLISDKCYLYMNGDDGPVYTSIDDLREVFTPGSESAQVWKFAVVDLDGDGEAEVVLRVIDAAGDMGGCMVLHCADGEVYGFAESYRAFETLKADGTYGYSSPTATEWGICRMSFPGRSCVSERIAHAVTDYTFEETSYYVGDEPVTEQEYDKACAQYKQKADAVWYDFGLEAVRAQFPSVFDEPEYAGAPEIVYHFEVRVSKERVLTAALETSEPEKDYCSIDRIFIFDGGTLIQTIETELLTPSEEYLWEGLFINRGHEEGEPDVRDVTFDGAQDFGLLCAATYPKNLPFTYFYWDEAEGRFVQGLTICGGGALEVDEEQKCLIEHWYDVYGEHTIRYA